MALRASWNIDPKALDRADRVPNDQIMSYLDSTCIFMHQALDDWRFHQGDSESFKLALEAAVALFVSAQNRGMAP